MVFTAATLSAGTVAYVSIKKSFLCFSPISASTSLALAIVSGLKKPAPSCTSGTTAQTEEAAVSARHSGSATQRPTDNPAARRMADLGRLLWAMWTSTLGETCTGIIGIDEHRVGNVVPRRKAHRGWRLRPKKSSAATPDSL